MRRGTLFALMMMLICLVRSAGAEITYQLVGQTAGDWSAEGTITTDGTLGELTISNVITSDIVVLTPTESFQLLPDPFDFRGVTATSTELSYDGESLVEDVLFLSRPFGMDEHGWLLTHEVSPPSIEVPFRAMFADAETVTEDITLPHVFAVVPEPSTATLLWFSLALIGRSWWKRR